MGASRLVSIVPLSLVLACAAACGGDDKQGQKSDADATAADSIFIPDATVFDTATATETSAPDIEEPDTSPPQPGEFGYACDENLDCNSGYCVQTADGRECTRTCIDSCPSGYDCRLAPGTDATFVCLPRFLYLCDPCRETTDCNEAGGAGNYCLGYGEKGRFCGVGCTSDDGCPSDYVCRNVPVGGGAEAMQCVPKDGAECKCSDFAKQAQRATTCFVENGEGKCEGTRFCLQGGLSLCDAATPFPESCNQLDDNCNGQKDEFPPGYVCEITNEFGSCPGTGTCTDGVEACVGTAPAPDVCDLIDNDCDGDTDEDVCDDDNDCTRDSCNPETGDCIHVNDDTRLCDDGSVCTQVDKCSGGACQGFNPVSCGDGNPCKSWTCDPVVGCLSSFNNAACEDGNPCTINDQCNLGVCVTGAPNPCNDNNECTTDSCTPATGCQHNNLQNGTGCQLAGVGQCQTSQCQNGACIAKSASDGTGCVASSSECPAGACTGGTCFSKNGLSCTTTYGLDLCQEVDVTGVCTSSGDCNVAQAPPGFTCPGCNGICIKCFITFCIPF